MKNVIGMVTFLGAMFVASVDVAHANGQCTDASCSAGQAANVAQTQSGTNTVNNTAAPTFVNPVSFGISGDINPSSNTVSTTAASCANDQTIVNGGIGKSWTKPSGNSAYSAGFGVAKLWNSGNDEYCLKMQELLAKGQERKNSIDLQNKCFSAKKSMEANGFVPNKEYYEAYPAMLECKYFFDNIGKPSTSNVVASNGSNTIVPIPIPLNLGGSNAKDERVQHIVEQGRIYTNWRIYVTRGRLSEVTKVDLKERLDTVGFPVETEIVFRPSSKYEGVEYVSVTGFKTKESAQHWAEVMRTKNSQPYIMIKPTGKLN